MTIALHPIHRDHVATKYQHGEPASYAHGIEIWAIGSMDGQVVWIQQDGDGWLGDPYRGHMRHLGRLIPPDQVPTMPGDDDGPGWDAWAATIRKRAAEGVQLSLFGAL